jgi:predicted dehydrogenase
MPKKVKIGMVGTGSVSDFHIQGYQAADNIELVAVCDINADRAKDFAQRYGIPHSFSALESMLSIPELEAVDVSLPNYLHAEAAIASLRAGKHVFCEKPMASDLSSAEKMVAAASEAGKLLMIAFVRRFEDTARIAKDFIDAGDLGDIYYSKVTWLRRCGNPSGWFTDKAYSGGGPLIDLGVHIIDLAWYLAGKPKPISVYGATFNRLGARQDIKMVDRYTSADPMHQSNIEDHAVALVRFANGSVLSVDTSFSLHIKEDTVRVELFGTKSGASLDPTFELFTDRNGYLANLIPQVDSEKDKTRTTFARELSHFADCVRGESDCICPAADGLAIMRIIDAIYRSAATGAEVRL